MEQPSKLLSGTRFLDRLGRENIMPNVQAALDRAKEAYEATAAVAAKAS
jgi:SulP family sulfate permease